MILRRFAFIFVLTLPCQANAGEMIYKLDQRQVIISIKDGVSVNKDCQNSSQPCQALLHARKLKGLNMKSFIGGKNPYSVICRERLKGRVVIGTDNEGNENSFCEFDDNSVISCASFSYFINGEAK